MCHSLVSAACALVCSDSYCQCINLIKIFIFKSIQRNLIQIHENVTKHSNQPQIIQRQYFHSHFNFYWRTNGKTFLICLVPGLTPLDSRLATSQRIESQSSTKPFKNETAKFAHTLNSTNQNNWQIVCGEKVLTLNFSFRVKRINIAKKHKSQQFQWLE